MENDRIEQEIVIDASVERCGPFLPNRSMSAGGSVRGFRRPSTCAPAGS